jgi:preprotein translocase subunit SecG
MIFWLVVVLHVLVSLFLILVVMLQSGKAADLAGAFGGMGSQTAFGPRSASTVLTKGTTYAAGVFLLTSLTLSILWTKGGSASGGTILNQAPKAKQTAPANPQDSAKPPVPVPQPVTPGQK